MSVLGMKLGRRIRGLGDGRVRDICTSSFNVHNLEKELETEHVARKAADATLVEMEQRMQNKMKLCGKVLGFVVPPFTPLSIANNADDKDDAVEDEENNFGDDQSHI
ncbi:Hypothetical predicted protein [Olea europaea subsp. europaea]|uniref:Uncharacterized protein n=1 Tax=Olea europaea subsp. europaea TaxID=158383 RepID=A0A8S0R1Z0_OLEEU|nr:Hypothetical predicted protein [Olea europaea subsp. europaea]